MERQWRSVGALGVAASLFVGMVGVIDILETVAEVRGQEVQSAVLAVVFAFALIAAAPVFIGWLWQVRANAELIAGRESQRLGRGRGIGAWFVPIIHLVVVPFVLSVSTNSPYKSVQEVLEAAKRQPGKMTYSSHGEGTPNHVAMLELLQKTGATMTHVPYKDGGILDVMSGVVDWTFAPSADAIPQIKAGKLRALAVSANARMPTLPDVPALSEIFSGSQLYSWNGILAPLGTPPEVIDRLSAPLQKIAASSEFQRYLLDLGLIPGGGTPAEFRSFLAKDFENWGAVVKQNGIRLD